MMLDATFYYNDLQLLADTQLIGLILVLLLMDTLVIGIWVAMDPLERHLYNLPRVVSSIDRSVVYQPQVRFVLIALISNIFIDFCCP